GRAHYSVDRYRRLLSRQRGELRVFTVQFISDGAAALGSAQTPAGDYGRYSGRVQLFALEPQALSHYRDLLRHGYVWRPVQPFCSNLRDEYFACGCKRFWFVNGCPWDRSHDRLVDSRIG